MYDAERYVAVSCRSSVVARDMVVRSGAKDRVKSVSWPSQRVEKQASKEDQPLGVYANERREDLKSGTSGR